MSAALKGEPTFDRVGLVAALCTVRLQELA